MESATDSQVTGRDLVELLGSTLTELDACVVLLDRHFPRPQLVATKRGPMPRHADGELDDLLASHLKCVRAVSALNSALILLRYGQIQDVYALCRNDKRFGVFFAESCSLR
jgi:hypothetical protein